MDLFGFVVTVVFLSASGVLSPGPLFVASVSRSIRTGGRSGIECAVGHTLVELPLVVGIALGSLTWLEGNPIAIRIIGLIGGTVLLFFAVFQLWEAKTSTFAFEEEDDTDKARDSSGIALGIAFTVLNPFFILWWLSIGVELITLAFAFGTFLGLLVMYLSHIWMDYAWLGGVGFAASKRRLSLGKWYRLLLVIFGLAMIYFGVMFIVSSVS